MLEFLHIENIAVAKNVEINFRNGFNVLTGETGAGKSIVIDSINMLQGAKVSKEIIRHGESRPVVSALFTEVSDDVYAICDEMGISYDREDSFSLSRSITVDGKNAVKINSKPSTLAQLKSIGSRLINIHGQNENQSFLNKNSHIFKAAHTASHRGKGGNFKLYFIVLFKCHFVTLSLLQLSSMHILSPPDTEAPA